MMLGILILTIVLSGCKSTESVKSEHGFKVTDTGEIQDLDVAVFYTGKYKASFELLKATVLTNSATDKRWLKVQERDKEMGHAIRRLNYIIRSQDLENE